MRRYIEAGVCEEPIISTEPYTRGGRRLHAAIKPPVSCTPEELEALVKIAAGDTRVGQENMRRLFMLRLVDRIAGVVRLTPEGRHVLGLAD